MSEAIFPRMHVSLYVSDISKTTDFYTSFFGQEPAKLKTNYAKYVLDNPSLIISFVENPERVQQNFGHLGFQVETKQELEERLYKAKAMDLVSKEEVGTACCYAVQDKFWVEDPDGVQWEVYYFHEDAEFNDPHYEMNDASACCMPPAKEEKPKVQLADISIISDADGGFCTPDSGCC
ncbi:ArsI/CadI family heavy metal resistance metalloenzyme [uncultured Pontibacter sp.]|uniref:ArsI/CadI family heavy metal resistance metalloenzyme n=1 Tax=uncultured Pontibacter sp. TaxID=453356 RepID=UPI00261283EE|nr:ArsI/CadI family heavy metal resistance metalloenzyme [uncultured Pontibacter sp.]